MASGCVPGSGGRQVGSGQRSSKSLLTRFIADLSLSWYTGCVIEYL